MTDNIDPQLPLEVEAFDPEKSNLVTHARRELALVGLLDRDSDYGGMLGQAVLQVVTLVASQGHSGASHFMTLELVEKLLRFEPLSPLTDAPEEWIAIEESMAGEPGLSQNRRDSAAFSRDGGKTYVRNGETAIRKSVPR